MKLSSKSAHNAEGRRKYLSRSEGKKFLEQAVNLPKLEALFCLTIFYTGCRISEALSVTPCHLDRAMKVLLIQSLKKRQRKETRRIPIPDFLIDELTAVFPNAEHQRIWHFSRTTGWRVIKSVMASAGIKGIHATTKGLRHGFGVRGALSHIPLNLIQSWMGHSDVTTTAIYLDVKGDEERELIQRTWN